MFGNKEVPVSIISQCGLYRPIPVAERSKEMLCGHSLAVVAGSNAAGGMNICLLRVSCVVW